MRDSPLRRRHTDAHKYLQLMSSDETVDLRRLTSIVGRASGPPAATGVRRDHGFTGTSR